MSYKPFKIRGIALLHQLLIVSLFTNRLTIISCSLLEVLDELKTIYVVDLFTVEW